MEPAAGIHHPDTYWVKNKSADNEGKKERERERNEKREAVGGRADRADARQRQEEEVRSI